MTDATDFSRRTVLKTIGAGVAAGTVFTGTGAAQVPGNHGLKRELAEVRSATAAYNDVRHATANGYAPEDHAVCGMGYHYANFDLVNLSLEKRNPQVMVYGEAGDGTRVLGAVEYMAPVAGPYESKSPDLFENDDPEWHKLNLPDGPTFWTLHAWVHNHNPAGVFHPTNPRHLFTKPEWCSDGGGSH